jgi:Uma2 family endonuclease
MNWSEVIADPCLQDLPYKIVLNQYGAIVMTPASNRHGYLQIEIGFLLKLQSEEGRTLVECSVDTPSGVKVADVAWLSASFVETHGEVTPFELAPELCVEILSPSNSRVEMAEKKQLYFDQGAQEVWLCSEAGTLEFFSPAGAMETSVLFPKFPTAIK